MRAAGRLPARALVGAGIFATCLLVAVVISASAQRQRQALLQKTSDDSLATIYDDTFKDPESIYKSELKKIRKTGIPISESLAWAGDSPSDVAKGLPQSLARVEDNLVTGERYMAQRQTRRRGSSLKGLEREIAKDVTREVLSKLNRVVPVDGNERQEARRQVRAQANVHRERAVRQEEYRARRAPQRQARSQGVSEQLVDRLQRAEQTLRADKLKEKRDEKQAEKLLSHVNTLANTFEAPRNPANTEITKVPLPMSDGQMPASTGPSDIHSYWLGDHYHDEKGPAGVFTGTEDGVAAPEEEGEAAAEGGEAPAEPEGEGERGGPGDEEEAAPAAEGEGEAEAESDPWAKRDNREKLQKLGVNVVSSTKEWLDSSKGNEDWEERELNRDRERVKRLNTAGLVTDRLPGLGENYRQAIPNPSYDPQPSAEEVSQDLEKGHRYVDAPEHKLQDAGVNVASNNILVPAEEGTNGEQRKFPYLDGIEDNMQAKEEAREHKPLWFVLDNIKKGTEKLQDKGVNVWGTPISLGLPNNFFDSDESATDQGSQKLKALGVRVNRYSMVPEHAPVPHEEDKNI